MNEPIFILSPPRSGSTLLSYLLNSCEDIFNVAESNFVDVLLAMQRAQTMTKGATQEHVSTGYNNLPSSANFDMGFSGLLRDLGDAFYSRLLPDHAGYRICDKSLSNVPGAHFLAQVWPDAKFLLLFRHCADVVASGIATGPWGVGGYGFGPYVSANPSNLVLAVSRCWLDRIESMQMFYDEYHDRALPVRYEDLVRDCGPTLERICEFLETRAPTDLTPTFSRHNLRSTPQDYKFRYTQEVSDRSIGRGLAVPMQRLVPQLVLQSVNDRLTSLGYSEVSDDWGSFQRVQSGDLREAIVASVLPSLHIADQTLEDDNQILVPSRTPLGNSSNPTRIGAAHGDAESEQAPESIELILTESGAIIWRGYLDLHGQLVADRVTNDPSFSFGTIYERDNLISDKVIVAAETLLAIASGYVSLGEAIQRGEVRYFLAVGGNLHLADQYRFTTGVVRILQAATDSLSKSFTLDGSLLSVPAP
jgi:hypothetical protein